MKRLGLQLALLVAALAGAGLLVAWLGLVPVAASAGHWPITSWFLHFTMRRAVKTQSLGTAVPPLEDRTLVVRGAGHYHSGCAPCHGAPGVAPARVTQAMSPPPPALDERIDGWRPQELFWVVKHGVKFTGMPAWVAQERDDEVWAMVAFLHRLPQLTAPEYLSLAAGAQHHAQASRSAEDQRHHGGRPQPAQSAFEEALKGCARCHQRDGSGRGDGAFPRLADQSEQYLFASLKAYADGARFSGIMQPAASGLEEATLRELARHYAGQSAAARPPKLQVDERTRRAGEDLARHGVPSQGIPSCVHCHGPSDTPRNPYYPRLAGQYAAYLQLQLELFRAGRRGGSPYRRIMNAAAHRLEPDQIRAVAHYYATLPPEGRGK